MNEQYINIYPALMQDQTNDPYEVKKQRAINRTLGIPFWAMSPQDIADAYATQRPSTQDENKDGGENGSD